MNTFLAICTFVGFCYVAAFMFKALGKVACWAIGGVAAIIGAVVVGSFAIVAATVPLVPWQDNHRALAAQPERRRVPLCRQVRLVPGGRGASEGEGHPCCLFF